jgi:hypothetical protein
LDKKWPVKFCHLSPIAHKTETGVLAVEERSLAQTALFVLATLCKVN